MFAMFVDWPRDIERPQRRGEREHGLWRGLALLGLIGLAGVALSLLAGFPTPSEQLTILEMCR
jgi:hypothetical protein